MVTSTPRLSLYPASPATPGGLVGLRGGLLGHHIGSTHGLGDPPELLGRLFYCRFAADYLLLLRPLWLPWLGLRSGYIKCVLPLPIYEPLESHSQVLSDPFRPLGGPLSPVDVGHLAHDPRHRLVIDQEFQPPNAPSPLDGRPQYRVKLSDCTAIDDLIPPEFQYWPKSTSPASHSRCRGSPTSPPGRRGGSPF